MAIISTRVSEAVLNSVIEYLLSHTADSLETPSPQLLTKVSECKVQAAERLKHHNGNLREALMDMYDWYRDRYLCPR